MQKETTSKGTEANKNFGKWLSCGIQISGTFGLHTYCRLWIICLIVPSCISDFKYNSSECTQKFTYKPLHQNLRSVTFCCATMFMWLNVSQRRLVWLWALGVELVCMKMCVWMTAVCCYTDVTHHSRSSQPRTASM
jgi:hypothetical protein